MSRGQTLTPKSRPVRWTDSDGAVRELRPGDRIPPEAIGLCHANRLQFWVSGGVDGGRLMKAAPAPEAFVPLGDGHVIPVHFDPDPEEGPPEAPE